MPSVLSFLIWCSHTETIAYIRESSFGMPALQAVHLVALTVLLASIAVLDLRLAGVTKMEWSLPAIERLLRPWIWAAFSLMIASGGIMFLGNPPKYLANPAFLFKMAALALAALCQLVLLRGFFSSDPSPRARSVNVAVSVLSLTLWFSVGWAGRVIAFI
jgi:hypothetical protein